MKFNLWIDQGACWDDDAQPIPDPDLVLDMPDGSTEVQAALRVADRWFRTKHEYFDGSLIVQREGAEYHQIRIDRIVKYQIKDDEVVTLKFLQTGADTSG